MVSWAQAKRIVAARDGCCVRCLGELQNVHHRRVRGMGGTSDPTIGVGLANLIGLCNACHSWVHAHPTSSYSMGYLVKMGVDPASVPVVAKPGSCVLWLREDGTVEYDEERFF